jgi:hypothetical protein
MEPRVLRPERSYADRIELLGLVAERHPYPEGWGDQRAGILLQTEWQHRSGRGISDADGRLDSWWPIANWTLTVWQLEALQRRGELDEVRLAERPLPLPDEVAAPILGYYDRLDELRRARAAREPARVGELQRLLWSFHVRAIEHGLSHGAPHLRALPAAEARFAESWGHCMVGLLAAVNSRTELDAMRGMQQILPPRLLAPDDWDPRAPSDLSEAQRRTLAAMRALYESEQASGGELERALRRTAATPAGERHAAKQLFVTLTFAGSDAPALLRARLDGPIL